MGAKSRISNISKVKMQTNTFTQTTIEGSEEECQAIGALEEEMLKQWRENKDSVAIEEGTEISIKIQMKGTSSEVVKQFKINLDSEAGETTLHTEIKWVVVDTTRMITHTSMEMSTITTETTQNTINIRTTTANIMDTTMKAINIKAIKITKGVETKIISEVATKTIEKTGDNTEIQKNLIISTTTMSKDTIIRTTKIITQKKESNLTIILKAT